MKLATFILILILIPLSVKKCNKSKPDFKLKGIFELREIASASGIEETSWGRFIIGDDSPYLFRLNGKNEVEERIRISPDRDLPDSLYEKAVKPDFEAIAKVGSTGQRLYIFGSGSKSPERDILVEINFSERIETHEFSLVRFYETLRSSANLTPAQLNIEAAEVYKGSLYLFNRGENLIAKYSLAEVEAHLKKKDPVPVPEIFRYSLPEIKGIQAGFSGASFAPEAEAFILTATVENTANWIDDGEVLGSFVGVLKIEDIQYENGITWTGIVEGENHLSIKVESVTVLPPFQRKKAELLLVTDSDGGISQILRATLTLPE